MVWFEMSFETRQSIKIDLFLNVAIRMTEPQVLMLVPLTASSGSASASGE